MAKDSEDKKAVDNETQMTVHRKVGFWREMWQQVRLVFRLIFDPEVPIYLKIFPFITLVYFLVPADLLPDILLGLGQLDDLAIILAGSKLFVELVPAHIVLRHLDEIRERDGLLQGVPGDDTAYVDTAVADTQSLPAPKEKGLEDDIIIDVDNQYIYKEDQ